MTKNRNWIRCHGKAKLTSDCGAGQKLTIRAWQEERAAARDRSASQLRKSLKAMARKEARAPRRREAIRATEKETKREGKGSKENTFKKLHRKIKKKKAKKKPTQMENQIKKKQSKTTNGIQRESKEIQCNIKEIGRASCRERV